MSDLFLSHRFLATFFVETLPGLPKIPYPFDIRFQSISGLSRGLDVTSYREGGENVATHHFPKSVTQDKLVFQRGVARFSLLSSTVDDIFSSFGMEGIDIIIILLNERSLPVSCWAVSNAIPVQWKTADLDANGNEVLIETFEFVYQGILQI